MSTKFKAIESLSPAAAREMERAIGSTNKQLNSIRREARSYASNEANRIANQLRSERRKSENRIINKLTQETNNKLSQLEVRQRKAMQQQADIINKSIIQQGIEFREQLNVQSLEFDSKLSNLDINIRADMRSQEKRLNANISAARKETRKLVNNLTKSVNREFERQQGQINTLNRDLAKTQNDIAGIRNELNEIYKKEESNHKMAEDLVNRCKSLIEECRNDISINRFESVKLRQIEHRLNTVDALGDNAPQAVISTALGVINDIWDLQTDTQIKQAIFDVTYSSAVANAISVLKQMEKNKNEIYYKDEKGKDLKDENGDKIKVEINYWMKGEYDELEEQLLSLNKELEQGKSSSDFTQERLEQILEEIKEIEVKEKEMVITAALRGIASQERANIANDIVDYLEENHFVIKDNGEDIGYMKSDFTEGVYANLMDGVGTDITVVIKPDETLTKNTILIQRNDDSTENPRQVEELRNLITNALSSNKRNKVVHKTVPDERLFDPSALKTLGMLDKEISK